MLEHKKIQNLNDYFVTLNNRQNKGVYFYRINGYSDEIGEFIKKYYDVARRTGIVIEGKIPNPDENNLAYYNEIMGMDFQMDLQFISRSLQKWLPRMNDCLLYTSRSRYFVILSHRRALSQRRIWLN